MSGTLNKVMLIGRLGDEVKMHYFDDANCIGRFPLATDESYTNKEGDRITNTDWHNIVVRNKAAEICSKYLTKGDLIYVEGRLKNRQWKGEDGQTRYSTEVHVNDFTFLSNKKEENKTTEVPKPKIDNPTAPTAPSNTNLPTAEQEDDLPF
ncbi:MAG: single-stranded DNA-binding protein [Flavobacteriaceae bacterium]|nr:single-stranded DNA-binding protein [Flavobacteriaceae bacterium]